MLRVTPAQCAATSLALAVLVAFAREWPPEPSWLLLVGLASAPFVAQLVLGRFLSVAAYAVPVLTAEVLMMLDPRHADPGPLLLLSLVITVAVSASGAATAVVAGASVAVVVLADVLGDADGALLWTVGLAISAFAGWAHQQQKVTLDALQAAQAQLAQRAALEERRRVAREVHDVVAHTLAVTMLHLTGARLALKDGDAEEAAAGLHEAERLGRESLAGLRRTVGLLTQDESATAPPAPHLPDLDQLVHDYRRGGAVVQLRVEVDRDVPEHIGLAAYRIVQESLANAVRHAPGAEVLVEVRVDADVLVVDVVDDGTADHPAAEVGGGGQGLPGMAERAALLGGDCTAGPRRDRPGWEVRARLPVADASRGSGPLTGAAPR